ncbi:hypothetical protein FRC17_001696 [Serendipita sp. 399]|nr:hypothetical protein FRC17_001696 [Serendipita sp. 399]
MGVKGAAVVILGLSTLWTTTTAKHTPHGDLLAKRRRDEASSSSHAKRASSSSDGQPRKVDDSLLGGFSVVGDSGVSAQMMFLGDNERVYILDKVEANPMQINGHPAWATVYDLPSNKATPLDIITNTFCAGGAELGDGVWVNVGGNLAVDAGGWMANVSANAQQGGNAYQDWDGGMAIRRILPGPGATWTDDANDYMFSHRWYPSLITLEDGRAFIMGGSKDGSFVNDVNLTNPTYEIYPKYEGETNFTSQILVDTLPANLYPITHLMPSGKVLVHSNRKVALLTYQTNEEDYLPSDPFAVRTYPASASSAMLPLRKGDDGEWDAVVMYCGGQDIKDNQWKQKGLALIDIQADKTCIKISEKTRQWEQDDDLPESRVMGNAILLPDSTILVINGAGRGVAGYADYTQPWGNDDSLADDPVLTPVIYDPNRPSGERWSREGLQASTIPRMYHSTATLLPDGSVMVSGSNPHQDYEPDKYYKTEYAVEIFYPLYYNHRRPNPAGVPRSLSYGGAPFTLNFTAEDLDTGMGSDRGTDNAGKIKVVLTKTGFSTHALNFGMRMLELETSYTVNTGDGSVVLHVNQLPTNPALFPPGNCWLFTVVDGVPSLGVQVMIGSGKIEQQPTSEYESLPPVTVVTGGRLSPSTTRNGAGRAGVSTGVVSMVMIGLLSVWFL